MKKLDCRWIAAALCVLCTTQAHAHFKLLQPGSWLNEDELGGPQKGSPCGPGNSQPFIGDDLQPVPVSDARTTFRAGETISIELEETIYHPGYFRIAIAETSAAEATTEHFPDPALTDVENCHYDRAAVKTVPHDNVLADGLFMAEAISSENRSLMQRVTLPDEACEHCTLQVVQVMEGHPASSCFYFHCADIQLLPAQDTNTLPPLTDESRGCSVSRASARPPTAAAFVLLGAAWLHWRRRRRVR